MPENLQAFTTWKPTSPVPPATQSDLDPAQAAPSEASGSGLSKPTASASKSARTTLRLAELLSGYSNQSMTWWETGSGLTYHSLRTQLHDGRIGLLIDPGAHDNLAGETTLRLLSQQLTGATQFEEKSLSRPLNVSGVGRSAQESTKAGKLHFQVRSHADQDIVSSYTAPFIAHSNLPALLGLKSLREKKCVLDTAAPALILPGPGGIEYRLSPGSQVFRLEVSDSGHLILPLEPLNPSPAPADVAPSTLSPPTRLDFNVRCRDVRSPSPPRRSVRRASSPPSAVAQPPPAPVLP